MLYPDAETDADDGPADTCPPDMADAGSDAAVLLFRRGPPGPFGSFT
jgi:hypothetical protein